MTDSKTATSPKPPSRAGSVHRLLVLHCPTGRTVGQIIDPGESTIVGRVGDDPSHLVLDDAEVSRQHAAIERHETGLVVIDRESRNGTFVNGAAVGRADVSDGDVLRIGGHLLLVQQIDSAGAGQLEPVAPDPNMVGRSHRMLAVLRQIQHAPPVPTLIVGETGVGKELAALAIHRCSKRAGPLVAVNCAALPEQLAESELFGHVAGSFTGATERRGLFVEADAGSLLLDEIGEMAPLLQAKLLRAIETGEIRPVGADRPRAVDVRIIAATNRDLGAEVERGQFRADLYARIKGEVIAVPPLRERREDILELMEHFLGLAGASSALTADAAEALVLYDWPFNVRELEQLARSIGANVSGARAIDLDDLPAALGSFYEPRRDDSPRPARPLPPVLGVPRRSDPTAPDLEQALRAFSGNIAKVASHFGKDRRQIYRWAERLGVDIERIRAELELKPSRAHRG